MERHVPQLVAVRAERGDAEAEEQEIAVRLAASLKNLERIPPTGIKKFDDRDGIRDVLLRVKRGQGRFDFLGDEFHP